MSEREIPGVYTGIAWRLNIFKCLFDQLQTRFPDLEEEGGNGSVQKINKNGADEGKMKL